MGLVDFAMLVDLLCLLICYACCFIFDPKSLSEAQIKYKDNFRVAITRTMYAPSPQQVITSYCHVGDGVGISELIVPRQLIDLRIRRRSISLAGEAGHKHSGVCVCT